MNCCCNCRTFHLPEQKTIGNISRRIDTGTSNVHKHHFMVWFFHQNVPCAANLQGRTFHKVVENVLEFCGRGEIQILRNLTASGAVFLHAQH